MLTKPIRKLQCRHLVTVPTDGDNLSDPSSTRGLSTSSDSSDDSSSFLDVDVRIRIDKIKRGSEWKEKITDWLRDEDKMVDEWYDISRPKEIVFARVDGNSGKNRLEVIVEAEDEE
jgi:hypothetical protein